MEGKQDKQIRFASLYTRCYHCTIELLLCDRNRSYIRSGRGGECERIVNYMSIQIKVPKERIADFCRRHRIRSFAFFGSVLRDEFGLDSDVDVMVEFEQGAEPGLMKLVDIENELSQILGREAELVERKSVEESENYIRRSHVLQSAETVYVA